MTVESQVQLRPKAILFDMDDTILVYEAVTEQAWRDVCRNFAPRIAGVTPDELFAGIYEVSGWYWSDPERHRQGGLDITAPRRRIVSIAFGRMGIKDTGLAAELADSYGVAREAAMYAVPGAMDLLNRCKAEFRLALVTNGASATQRRKIERFGLSALFDHIIIEGEFGAGKPDERVFRHALKTLGVAASEALMVGDDLERDIGGAQNVGIAGVWVDWRGEGLPALTDVRPATIIRSVSGVRVE